MEEEQNYEKSSKELKEITKLCFFKHQKWEDKYKKWLYIKQGKLNMRFGLVMGVVAIFLSFTTIMTLLRNQNEDEQFVNIGKLYIYSGAGCLYLIDLIFVTNLRLLRFHGFVSSLVPYLMAVFRCIYFNSFSIPYG